MSLRKNSYALTPEETGKLNLLIKDYLFSIPAKTRADRVYIDQLFECRSSKNFTYIGKTRPIPKARFKIFCKNYESKLSTLPLRTKEVYVSWKSRLESAYLQLKEQKAIQLIEPKPIVKEHTASHPFLSNIKGTVWHSYELEAEAISKRVVKFLSINKNGYCDFELRPPHKLDYWIGDVRFIEADNLLVGICRSEARKDTEAHYTHFTIQINDRSKELELCVGHKTFFSQRTKNVVTKTVILEKIKTEDYSPEIHQFDDKTIDWKIRSFFSNRLRNRLTSPHSLSIHNHQTFETWMLRNKYVSKVDKSIEGTYQVMYKLQPSNSTIEKDYLTISRSMSGQLLGLYEEKKHGKVVFYWEGAINENVDSNTLSIFMDGPKKDSIPQLAPKPLFLMLTVPSAVVADIDTLSGIIAGIRQGNRGAVARLVLITKCDDNRNCKDYDPEKVAQFFEKFRESSKVRPPYEDIICNFSDLKEILEPAAK